MNLKSCDNCGVVLDLSKMNFSTNIDDEEVVEIEWNGDSDSPVLPCPVCKADIVNEFIHL